jgi:GAF domain-containing protein
MTVTEKTQRFAALKPEISQIIETHSGDANQAMQGICDLLQSHIAYYNWVGFYFKNGDKPELKLRVFAGEPTDHTIIPFGKGICGQVAESNTNFVVPDIMGQDNYIACSIDVKSEIVVPLFLEGENIGQIDIDSHVLDPFTAEDEDFLEFINREVATLF